MTMYTNLRILVVDDNPEIHNDFLRILITNDVDNDGLKQLESEILGQDGHHSDEFSLPKFEIDTALQGQEAVQKITDALQVEKRPYALAFVDIRMPPGWDGVETIKRIWAIDPDIQIVICTAFSDYTWEETIKQLGHKDNLLILKKPFDNIAVRQLACALTKKWSLLRQLNEHANILESQVSERTRLLSESLSISRGTLESTADGLLVVNQDNEIIDWNSKLIDMWNLPQEIMENKNANILFEYLVTQTINEEEINEVIKTLSTNLQLTTFGKIKCKNNSILEYYSQPYKIKDQLLGRIWSFRDNTRRIMLEEKLQYQALYDDLTGLPNRSFLQEHFIKIVEQTKKTHSMFGLLFFDIDRFKLINDSFNHLVGDELLCTVAKRIQSCLRQGDFLGRFGGDEFVVIVNQITDKNDLIKIASKLLEAFNDRFKICGEETPITTSIGISIYPDDGKDFIELLRNADSAMYRAKRKGRDRFEFYNVEFSSESLLTLRLEADLHRAIDNNEFFLCYQPEFEIASQRIVSAEALIRWRHPENGLISPVKFIPLAEQNGLIDEIGEWVLRTACKQNKEWQRKGLSPIRIAVNVSFIQLRRPNFVNEIKAILKETELAPEYLELELTESCIINNEETIARIEELRNFGVHFAIDDFGSGYSALNYLRDLPVNKIKIDQSFISNINVNTGDEIIIKAIIAIAKGFHLSVVAEGVETQSQLDFLSEKKCSDVQGDFYSNPLTAKEFETLLKTGIKMKSEAEA